jgi:hypothetical protein
MAETVKVKLIRTHLSARPGEIIRAFGHDFIMQPNGEAHCDMHKDFIPTEVAARRIEVIEPGEAKPHEVVPELSGFTMDVADYFGTGSIDALTKQLSRLRKDLLQEFVLTRFSIEIPSNIPNPDIIRQIKNLCERATGKTVLKISKMDTPEDKQQDPVEPTEQEKKKSSKKVTREAAANAMRTVDKKEK